LEAKTLFKTRSLAHVGSITIAPYKNGLYQFLVRCTILDFSDLEKIASAIVAPYKDVAH